MTAVYRVYCEAVGEGVAICKAHWDAVRAAKKTQLDLVKTWGAEGFRPGHTGAIRSLLFAERMNLPGLKEVGREGRFYEYSPRLNTKGGKEYAKTLDKAPRCPVDSDLSGQFVTQGEDPCDGYSIYWPGVAKVEYPKRRYFITVPVYAGKTWTPPDTLKEVRESEYLAAFEDHNAYVRSRNKRAA